MRSAIKISSIKGLQPIEIVVLTNVVNIYNEIQHLQQTALQLVSDGEFTKAQKAVQEAQYFKYNKTFYTTMQEQVLEHCSLETLDKIVRQRPFESVFSWDTNNIILPIELLPKFSSSKNIKSTDHKAEIYKALGATIIL